MSGHGSFCRKKEALIQTEIEETDRQFALSMEKGARPKVYDELKCRTKEDNISEIGGQIVVKRENEFDKRKDRGMVLLQEGNSLKRQQELHIEEAGSDRVQSSAKQEGQKSADIDRNRRPFNIPEVNPNVKPFLSSFLGAEPVPNKAVSFETWKLETRF